MLARSNNKTYPKLTREELIQQFNNIVGTKRVLTKLTQTAYYRSGFRSGSGTALAVVFPKTILEQWKLIKLCVAANCIIIMQAANGQRESVSIFGNDYDTNDGTCVRDYIHVNDLANAHLKGLDYLNQNESPSAEFNLGNGNGFSVKEVIQQVKEITGKSFLVNEEGRRDGDPSTLIASDKKAKKELNLSPDYVSLESIIKTLD